MPAPSQTHTICIDAIINYIHKRWNIPEIKIYHDKQKKINSSEPSVPKIGHSFPDVYIRDNNLMIIGEAKASRIDFDESSQFEDYIKEIDTRLFHKEITQGFLVVATIKSLEEYAKLILHKKFPDKKDNIIIIPVYDY